MNEGHLSRPSNSKVASSTPIKIKNNYILENKNNFILTSNPYCFYSTSINTKGNKNNKTLPRSERKKDYNSLSSEIKKIKKKNLYLINYKYSDINKLNKSKNKNINNINFILYLKKNKYKNRKIYKLKQNSLLTYNFNKDTQKVHYSTIIFKKKEITKNKNIQNTKNFENYLTNFITDYTDKTNNNKNLKKYSIKRNSNNKLNYKNDINNKIEENEKSGRNIFRIKSNDNNLYDNILKKSKTNSKINHKLIDSPDSMFYYIYKIINDKQHEDNLKQKIYYSKLDMIKKFRYFKKGLENLEQRTNFEIFNLKRQIIPEQETKLTRKIISNL